MHEKERIKKWISEQAKIPTMGTKEWYEWFFGEMKKVKLVQVREGNSIGCIKVDLKTKLLLSKADKKYIRENMPIAYMFEITEKWMCFTFNYII